MRKIKKLLSIVFVLAIMASICIVPASAAVKDEEVAQPLAARCDVCGGQITSSTSWGSWYVDKPEVDCTHYNYGYDKLLKRTGVKTTKCEECGLGDSTVVTQTKRECHGYN